MRRARLAVAAGALAAATLIAATGPARAAGAANARPTTNAAPTAGAALPAPVYFDIPNVNGVSIHACRLGDISGPPKPVVLEWTNYTIDNPDSYPAAGCPPQFKALAASLVSDGYIYVAGQTRGVGQSTGVADVWSSQDGEDGFKVVEWLAAQPWSTHKVGLAGCSSSSMEGLQIAVRHPAHLDAVVMSCFGSDAYRDAMFPGGLRAYSVLPVASRPLVDLDYVSVRQRIEKGDTSLLGEAAQRLAIDAVTEAKLYSTTEDAPFWRDKSTGAAFDAITAPMLAMGNWADFFLRGTFEWERHRKPGDKLVMLPGWHGDSLAVPGPFGMTERAHAWFDTHLKGLPDRYAGEPPVVYWELDGGFTHGSGSGGDQPKGRFHNATDWPPPAVRYQRWTFGAPDGNDTLAYPSGSPGSTTDMRGLGQPAQYPPAQDTTGAVVTWTGDVLASPLHLAGPVTATIWATPHTVDGDLYVRLEDLKPDGTFKDITNGWLRGVHRAVDPNLSLHDPATGEIIRPWHPHDAKALLTPETPAEFVVELWQTATELPKGDRLRVLVSMQDTPWFLQDTPPGAMTVLADAAHPSRLMLPVQAATTDAAPFPVADTQVAAASAHAAAGFHSPDTGWDAPLALMGLLVAAALLLRRARTWVR